MKKNICVIAANYYPYITKDLIKGTSRVLKKKGIKNFKIIISPGIFEIPVIIARNIKKYDAFIALGCVIKGQTPHFEFISSATTIAIMNLSVKYKKPIGNGIITCLNRKQAEIRSKIKGREAAKAVISVLSN